MNLFLADSLNISIQLLFAVLVIVSLLLLGVVLMQRPKQEGLGAAFGAAITDQAFGARTTDVLKKPRCTSEPRSWFFAWGWAC